MSCGDWRSVSVLRRGSVAACSDCGLEKGVEGKVGLSTSVAEVFETFSVRDSEDIFCLADVCAVADTDWVAVAENILSVTKGVAEKTGVKNGLEKVGDRKLDELYSGLARDV